MSDLVKRLLSLADCGAEGLTDLSNDVCVACLAWWMPLPEPPTTAE